jgi:hypothetical protein
MYQSLLLMVATGSTLEEANGQKAALNMAKFIKGQSLELLGRLEELELDERAEQCERLHEMAEELLAALLRELPVEA